MSALDSLIRLYKWQLDERRQQVAELERLENRLKAELQKLHDEVASEQRAAADNEEAGRAWAGWSAQAAARRKTLETSIAEAQEQMVRAREALAEAFQEVKRYEIALAAREKRDRIALSRRAQQRQDEIALQTFRNRRSA
jgi:chromosome segregation ATPase